MIDLETMGKNPDAPIISIGAIFFDPQTGDMGPEFSKTIDLETAGGVIDRDTIKWWLKQSREAQSAIMTDEIPLDDALLQLREFIDENSGEFFVQVDAFFSENLAKRCLAVINRPVSPALFRFFQSFINAIGNNHIFNVIDAF